MRLFIALVSLLIMFEPQTSQDFIVAGYHETFKCVYSLSPKFPTTSTAAG